MFTKRQYKNDTRFKLKNHLQELFQEKINNLLEKIYVQQIRKKLYHLFLYTNLFVFLWSTIYLLNFEFKK